MRDYSDYRACQCREPALSSDESLLLITGVIGWCVVLVVTCVECLFSR